MIIIKNLSIKQGAFELQHINLEIPESAYAVLMGASGSGKTTILEAICGLRQLTAGSIHIGSNDVTHLRPAERQVAYVPQDRALFPGHLVREQLAFSLILRKMDQETIGKRVNELADLLGITHLLDRMPHALSGGEAQRVSLGRALAAKPQVLCLDEPLSALDEDMRSDMCALLKKINEQTGVTVCHITHSAQEAQVLGNCFFKMYAAENGNYLRSGTFESGVWEDAP